MSTFWSWMVCSDVWTVVSSTGLVGSVTLLRVVLSSVGLGFCVGFSSVICGKVVVVVETFFLCSSFGIITWVVDFSLVAVSDVVICVEGSSMTFVSYVGKVLLVSVDVSALLQADNDAEKSKINVIMKSFLIHKSPHCSRFPLLCYGCYSSF